MTECVIYWKSYSCPLYKLTKYFLSFLFYISSLLSKTNIYFITKWKGSSFISCYFMNLLSSLLLQFWVYLSNGVWLFTPMYLRARVRYVLHSCWTAFEGTRTSLFHSFIISLLFRYLLKYTRYMQILLTQHFSTLYDSQYTMKVLILHSQSAHL